MIDEETRARFRAELRKSNGISDTEPKPDFTLAVKAMIGETTPSSAADIKANDFATRIVPQLKSFKFDTRYHRMDLLAGKDSRCAQQRAALDKVKAKFVNAGAIVALIGPRGTGKTTIAAELATERLWEDWRIAQSTARRGVPCRVTSYRKAADLLAKFKAYYGDFGTIGMEGLAASLEHLASVECLVIDELHEVPEDSKHKDRLLTDLLDKRYAKRRDTLIISNQLRAEFERTLPTSIKSRLSEHGGIIACEWQSFRERAAQ